jgi:hypothetical protein
MNITTKKLSAVFLGILTCSACSLPGSKKAGEIDFNDYPLFTKKTTQYEGFIGEKMVYCLAGNYRTLKAGSAADLHMNIYTFSIAAALNKFPQLEDTITADAAGKQQEFFRKRHSRLFNEDFWSRYNHPRKQPSLQSVGRSGLGIRATKN